VAIVGCTDGNAACAFSQSGSFIVQALVPNPAVLASVSSGITEQGRDGTVTAALLSGDALPYIDNTINLLVAESLGAVTMDEVMRVLVPGGSAAIAADGQWKYHTKSWPSSMDQWTHYMHDPGNNAVANDSLIGPPRHLQWTDGPKWARHHDNVASLNAMVSEAGKLFYIMDEGSIANSLYPAKWRLVARDAFNGVVLWKRSLPEWIPNAWPLKGGPASLPRRLVAVGGEVYAPMGFNAPVSALDGSTGRTLRTYAGSENVEEIIVEGDQLFALITSKPLVAVPSAGMMIEAEGKKFGDKESRVTKTPMTQYFWKVAQDGDYWYGTSRTLKVYDLKRGSLVWERSGKVMPLSLAVDSAKCYFHDGERVVALDRSTGERVFSTAEVPVAKKDMMSYFAPTLVVKDGVLVFAGGENIGKAWMGWEKQNQGQDTMTAFSTEDGRTLWTAPHPYGGYNSPEDVLIARGLVWTADTAKGGAKGPWIGRDLHTGEVVQEIPPTVNARWFHHRCYRAKATENFMIPSRNGIEYIDLDRKEWIVNNWVRSGCLYGVMPANGLTYAAPHNCTCHSQSLLHGFNALAASAPTRGAAPIPAASRLQRGPAYAAIIPAPDVDGDWPLYRGRADRGGSTEQLVRPQVEEKWRTVLGGKLTQPVVHGDVLVVAQVDTHRLFAFSADSGKPLWQYTAGGRVNSSPTGHEGRILFGSADGTVTCLDARNGEQCWTFRAAANERQLVSYGQLESVWPVYGTVLVQDNSAWVTAGRSFFVDGGVRFYKLDVSTGKILAEKVFTSRDFVADQDLHARASMLEMPVAKPGILGRMDDNLFMNSQLMDQSGVRTTKPGDHIVAPFGFLDDTWFHRGFWVYGTDYDGGCGYAGNGKKKPSGKIMVHDDEAVYIFGREFDQYRWITEMEFRLYRTPRNWQTDRPTAGEKGKGKRKRHVRYPTEWQVKVPLHVRAMVKTADSLFVAGTVDNLDENTSVHLMHDPVVIENYAQQAALFEGEQGGVIKAIDPNTGEERASLDVDFAPAFDGISVAHGRLYAVGSKGELVCME